MKRSGEDTQNGTPEGQPSSSKKPRTEDDDDLDDDDLPTYAPSKLSSQKRLGRECPYLDTVSRQVGCQNHVHISSMTSIGPCLGVLVVMNSLDYMLIL